MPIGTDSGEYHDDDMDYLKANADKKAADAREIAGNERSNDFQSRFLAANVPAPQGMTRLDVYRGARPDVQIEDRTGQSLPTMLKNYVGEQFTTEKFNEVMSHPSWSPFQRAEDINAKLPPGPAVGSQLSIDAGLNDLRRPLQAPTEPAGEFKSDKGSEVAPEHVKYKTAAGPEFNITDEDIERGMNVALSAGPGTIAGMKAIGNLTGAAKNEALSNLGHAQVLESNAVHPDEIQQRTGFHRGAEGRWKYEINDSKAKFDKTWADNPTPGEQAAGTKAKPLGEVWDHPELYKAYPDLKNLRVRYDNKMPANAAHYDAGSMGHGEEIVMGRGAHQEEGTLAHEVQHAIQEREGFAKGGAPGKARIDFRLKLEDAMEEYKKQATEAWKGIHQRYKEKSLTSDDLDTIEHIQLVTKKWGEYIDAANKAAKEFYMRLAGETEARNVDTRLLLTEAERRRIPISESEDIGRQHQIVVDTPSLTTAYGIQP